MTVRLIFIAYSLVLLYVCSIYRSHKFNSNPGAKILYESGSSQWVCVTAYVCVCILGLTAFIFSLFSRRFFFLSSFICGFDNNNTFHSSPLSVCVSVLPIGSVNSIDVQTYWRENSLYIPTRSHSISTTYACTSKLHMSFCLHWSFFLFFSFAIWMCAEIMKTVRFILYTSAPARYMLCECASLLFSTTAAMTTKTTTVTNDIHTT